MAIRAWSNVTPDQAVASLLARITPVPTRRAALTAGAILRQRVTADRPNPSADVSAMDGYAVRVTDLDADRLPVKSTSLPGREPEALKPGEAMRIFTGAGVPPGADAVIKREDVGEHESFIELRAPDIAPGANIRRRGENLQAGDPIAEPGDHLHPARIGALRAFGADEVDVSRPVRVSVITTGDEIVTHEPNDWQLRDSNGAAIEAWIHSTPWCELHERRHAIDTIDAVTQLISQQLDHADLLLMTGGVSVGDHDHVRDVLESLGADVLFHGVTQRPGKPALGAIAAQDVPIIALPGNPVSVLVGLRRLVAPVAARLAGTTGGTADAHVTLAATDGRTLGLTWFRLVQLIDPSTAQLIDTRGSGDLASSARADGFVEIAPKSTGEGPLPFYRWS